MADENKSGSLGNDLDIRIGIEIDKSGAKDKLKSLVQELEGASKVNLGTNVSNTSEVVKETTKNIKKQKVEVLELGRGYKQISEKMKQMYADASKGTTVDIDVNGATRKVKSFVATVKQASGEVEKVFYKYDKGKKGYVKTNETYGNPTNSLKKKQLNDLEVIKKEFDNKFAKMFNQYDTKVLNTPVITKGVENIKASLGSLNKLNYGEFTQQVKLIRKEFDALKISADKIKSIDAKNKAEMSKNTDAKSQTTNQASKDKEVADEKKRLEKIENYRKDFNIKMQNLSRTTGEIFKSPEAQKELDGLKKRLANLDNVSLDNLQNEFKQISLGVKQFSANMNDAKSQTTWIDKIGKNTSKFFEWYVSANLIMQTKQALSDSVRQIMAMNEAMVELNKVTDMSDKSLESMKVSAMSLSKQLGKDSTEIMASMAEFGRVTKDREQIVELSRVECCPLI